jgi:hypothetical protein
MNTAITTTTTFIVNIFVNVVGGKQMCVDSSHKKTQLLLFGIPLTDSKCFAPCDSAIKFSDVVLCVQPAEAGQHFIKHEACWR